MAENFEKLLDESFEDPEMRKILDEKVTADGGGPISVEESVKDYPKPQRTLDLHGHAGEDAMFELENFLNHAVNQRVLTVCVITGKGLHSKNMKSVLPELTERKLAQFKRSGKVLTFRRERSGGSYVVYLVS